MASVPQKTLNWLWGVLQREYRDPQRVYADLAQTLAVYPAFAPRTDVYTSENGSSALLLHLTGTVPVNYRGSQYRFPVAIWIPHAYPYESPIFYVKPTEDMVIRPGQHVSPSDGRIYHPYLARWREAWERSTVVDFLKMLADIFAREPPVMSRQQMAAQPGPPPQTQQAPPRPPPPNQQRPPSVGPQLAAPGPPPPPPKPTDQINGSRPPSVPAQDGNRPGRYDAPPPLPGQSPPPRPPSITSPPPPQTYQTHPQYLPQRQSSLRQSYQPPQQLQQPPQAQQQPQPQPHPPLPPPGQYQPQRQSIAGPSMPVQSHQQQQQQQPPVQTPAMAQPPPQSTQPPTFQQQQGQPPSMHYPPQQPQPYQQQQSRPAYQQQPPPQPQPAKPKAQQPNIMDDSPFDVSLPTSSANLPTPAIPPNPEKQHILQSLQSTLLTTLQTQISQSSSALAPLQSQHMALQAAHQTLQQELNQLQTLHSQLQQNVSSLNSTISSADRTISSAQNESSPSKIPNIDDLIIPPTVVARQLYDSVAEQRGYEAAIYALTEGLVRGRIGGEIWARKTRECAREEFKKKWLVRRVGRGMGLDMSQMEL